MGVAVVMLVVMTVPVVMVMGVIVAVPVVMAVSVVVILSSAHNAIRFEQAHAQEEGQRNLPLL